MIDYNPNSFIFLYDETNLYGACSNDDPQRVDGYVFYFSHNECSFDRLTIEGRPDLSSGRVLRAFNLSRIYNIVRQPFIYCGLILQDASAYNKSMGLFLFKHLGIPLTPNLIKYLEDQSNEPKINEDMLSTFDPDYSNFLFFVMNPEVLEVHHVTPYTVIQYCLPPSKKGGKRKKTKRKKTKRNKNSRN